MMKAYRAQPDKTDRSYIFTTASVFGRACEQSEALLYTSDMSGSDVSGVSAAGTPQPATAPCAGRRRVIVTGASRGIGAAIARRLAAAEFDVVVNYCSRAEDADAVVKSILEAGGRAVAIQADVGKRADLVRLWDEAETATFTPGRSESATPPSAEKVPIYALVQNAGLGMPGLVSLKDHTAELVDRLTDVNLKGVLYGLQLAAERLVDGGRIVNIGSTAVATRLTGYGIYSATKAAVESLTHIAAKELGARKIAVNCVAPGPITTELFFAGKSPEVVARMAAATPQGRLGEPEEVAGIVAFLCGEECGWVSGQVIRVNGGIA